MHFDIGVTVENELLQTAVCKLQKLFVRPDEHSALLSAGLYVPLISGETSSTNELCEGASQAVSSLRSFHVRALDVTVESEHDGWGVRLPLVPSPEGALDALARLLKIHLSGLPSKESLKILKCSIHASC